MGEKREVVQGQVYRHFKGKLYQVITIAHHSETGENLVVYQKLYGDYSSCARPYDMFISEVDREKYPDATQKYRFELITGRTPSFAKTEETPLDNKDFKDVNDDKDSSTLSAKSEVEEIKEHPESKDINPKLVKFLDNKTFKEKANYLKGIRRELDNQLIDNMAASIDVTVDESDDINKRYESLLKCIETRAKYEVDRLR